MTLSSEAPTTAAAALAEQPTAMRAVVIDAVGAAPRVGRAPRPSRVMSEVLVRVMAAGLNPVDLKAADGRVPAGPAPTLLGCDFSGIVEESPFEAFGLQPGDEVYGVSGFPRIAGSFAEAVSVPASNVALKPRVLSHTEAAAVPVAALTAWGAVVELVKAHEGQRVLIHGGSGGVGHLAVQIAAYFGAHVIATASPANVDWVRDLGAAQVVDRTSERFDDVVDEVDAVIDLVGDGTDEVGPRSLALLRPGGLFVSVPSGSWPTLLADAAAAGVRATHYRMLPDPATLAVIARLITSGDLRVMVQRSYPMGDIAEAMRDLGRGHTRGKLVLQVADY